MKKSKKRIDGEEEGESLNDYLQGVRGQIYWDCCTSKEANRVEDGEEDEPGEEEDGDSLTELYFQPKYQDEANRLKIDMKLEVMKAHLEHEIEERLIIEICIYCWHYAAWSHHIAMSQLLGGYGSEVLG